MDPVAYAPLPSAPPAHSVISVNPAAPVPLTIRIVGSEASEDRRWGTYCCFIVVAFIVGCLLFYYVFLHGPKN